MAAEQLYRTKVLEVYNAREWWRKLETACAGFAWLVGCIVLCMHSEYGKDATWGLKRADICGAYSYSVSTSMTGFYPKLWGNVWVTLFAVLVTQRSTNGLCSGLKHVWLRHFAKSGAGAAATKQSRFEERGDPTMAPKLWKRIQTIEFLSYVSAVALVGLAAFDTKNFPATHDKLAAAAFATLYAKNFKVGMLERDFSTMFPGWANPLMTRVFLFGAMHLQVFFVLIFAFNFLHGAKRCDLFESYAVDPLAQAGSAFMPGYFGTPGPKEEISAAAKDKALWLLSAFFWYCEYCTGIVLVLIQLSSFYDKELMKLQKTEHLAHFSIISRFSLLSGVVRCCDWAIGGKRRMKWEMEGVSGGAVDVTKED